MAYCCGYEYYNMGHMDMECSSEEGEYFCLPVNLFSDFEKESNESKDGVECCICYETIGEKNNCVTECGHRFCFGCMLKAMTYNTACPYCRKELLEENAAGEEEDEEEYQQAQDEGEEDDDSDSDVEYGHVEDLVQRLERNGITMLDVVSVLFNKYSKRDAKYTPEYIERLDTMLDQLEEEVEKEAREKHEMSAEDRDTEVRDAEDRDADAVRVRVEYETHEESVLDSVR